MLLMPDKKKMASVILAKMSNKDMPEMKIEKEECDCEETDYSLAMADCMKRLVSAIEKKDHQAMALAFEHAFQILESKPHYENESEEKKD